MVVDQFGGLCTSIDRSDLPNGLASTATDVEYFPGGFQSRGPFTSYLASSKFPAAPVNSILSFPRNDGTRQRLFLLANGTLQYEYPEGTVTTIETLLGNNSLMRGCVLNNRAFMAFSDGKSPTTRPRWWNGTWFDPVGQEGPSLLAGSAAGNAGAGNATASGSALGSRQYFNTFETRGGYVTLPSSSGSAVAVLANDQYKFQYMPIPPANVIKQRVGMTANLGTDFYMPPSLVQAPPAGGNWTVPYSAYRPGFSDTDFAGSSSLMMHERLTNWVLPPCLGVETYSSRLVAWGALNYVPKVLTSNDGQGGHAAPFTFNYTSGFRNGTFTGGVDFGGTNPSGWGIGAAGGALVTAATAPGCTLAAYQITGDGSTATRGTISQALLIERYNDFPIGTETRIRIRAKRSSGTNGRLVFRVVGGTTATVTILVSALTTDWAWYDTQLSGQPLFSSTDTTVGYPEFFVDNGASSGTMGNGATVTIDEIQMYNGAAPNLNGYLLVSMPFDPETFDLTRGLVGVRPGDGQGIINAAELRGTLYAFKERAIFGVQDNGGDPNTWAAPTLMSDNVGCMSVHGVGKGDGFLVTISETGAYSFSGGQPDKISQEIQPTWARINFNYKHLSWCVVDTDAQRTYIGVPLNSAVGANDATYVNALLVCDFVSGVGDPVASPGAQRKWSIWTPPATPGFPCGARIDRDNGQRAFVVGGGVANTTGYVSARIPTTWGGTTDTFSPATPNIMAVYETATLGQPMERSFFGFALAKIRGTGGLNLSLVRPDTSVVSTVTRTLSAAPLHDLEWMTKQMDTQIGLRFANAVGGAFSMRRTSIYQKRAAFSRVRGTNG